MNGLHSGSGRLPEMRILHCIPSLGGGGAERQLAYLGEAMACRGISTHVAYLHDGPNSPRLHESPVVLHRIECAGNHDPRILFRLWRIAVEQRPHLIQTWLPQMDILGAIVAHAVGVPFILAERSCESAYGRGWKNAVRRFLGRRAAAIVANSEGGRAYWIKQGHRGSIKVIPNGIPIDELESATLPEPIAGIDGTTEVIGYAGRFSVEKNIEATVTALLDVLRRRPHAVALLFGEGPLEEAIAALCASAGECASRLLMPGYSTELWRWLRRADVFVSVSHFEGQPNAVLEAAALGSPLVVSDIPAHREFLDETSAWMVPTTAPEAIADAVCDALSRREVARARAARARTRVRAFAVTAVVDQYIDLYAELILGSGSRLRLT